MRDKGPGRGSGKAGRPIAFASSTTPLTGHRARAAYPSFKPGVLLAERYRVGRMIGRGGMGEVYAARDEELAIPVALKTVRFDLARDPRAVWQLKREILLARSITHRNVCRVFDLGRHGRGAAPVWFLSMELLGGETLSDRLRRSGAWRAPDALPIAEQMAAGLAAAHQAGVVHLDFKSANVMLVKDREGERAVVTDFGLARAVLPAGKAGDRAPDGDHEGLAGTLAYMAPEQLRAEDAGPAADIYSFGVVLYEMVTGRLPFLSGTPEHARRRLWEAPPPPRSIVRDLDERWNEAILRCLAIEPGDRFRDPLEVAEAMASRGGAVMPGAPRAPSLLPSERDSFLGREPELEELARNLENGSRLVTIVGAAGMGKSRLARRYAWQSLAEWSGGVWFCDLTEARSVDGIASAVADSLGMTLGTGDPVEQLGHAVAGRARCLVILDNCEQVAEGAASIVDRWLARACEARFVITSRERLDVPGEYVHALGPLDIERGVELFIERARRQRPDFEARGADLERVHDVVRALEGVPLAIELAAARVRVMTVGQVAERMEKRLQLLGGSGRGRHASLRTAIDASWELLRDWEKAALAQCSVFDGGFTLEAAEHVVDLGPWPEAPWVVDVVQSLVDKSLLRMWLPPRVAGDGGETAGEARFGMYMSIQEYAREKLRERSAVPGDASGASSPEQAAEKRHGAWYARYGTEESLDALSVHGGLARRRRHEREFENLVAACRRALERKDGPLSARLYGAVAEILGKRGPVAAAVELGRQVLEIVLDRRDRLSVLVRLGDLERTCGEIESARAHNETALAVAREVGDRRAEGLLLGHLADLHGEQGRLDEARAHYEMALAIARDAGDRHLEAGVLRNLGSRLHHNQGRMEEARAHYERALAIARDVGDRRLEGVVLVSLGGLHHDQGQMEEAHSQYEAARVIARAVGDRGWEGVVLGNLGNLRFHQGRMEEARAHYEAALAAYREVGDRRVEGIVLGNLGGLHSEQGRMEEARALFESALAIHRELENRRSEGVVLGNLGNLHFQHGRMEEAEAHYEAALSIHRELGDRHSQGVVLGNLGRLDFNRGKFGDARARYDAALAIHRHLGDRRFEGIVLVCTAALDRREGRMEEAHAHYDAALAVAREVADRRLEGMVLGSIAGLHQEQGRMAEAGEVLALGEALLREVGDMAELGKLLCTRGTFEAAGGDLEAARTIMMEVETLTARLGAGPGSELASALDQLRRSLGLDA